MKTLYEETVHLMLKKWLLGREEDIACGLEDLGGLKDVFFAVVGREARDGEET